MMTTPVQPTSPISQSSFKSTNQSQNNVGAKSKETDDTDMNIEWYCNGCKNYFKVPDPVKYKYNPSNGELCRYKILNCPFCGSENIINNREAQFKSTLWMNI